MAAKSVAHTAGVVKDRQWDVRTLAALALLFLIPMALFLVLRVNSEIDAAFQAEQFHFWIVSGASILGLITAIAVLISSIGRDDIWVFFVGLGLLSISGVFLLHSLATESILFSEAHPSFSVAPPASLAAGAVLFGLSAIRYPVSVENVLVRIRPAMLALWAAAYSSVAVSLFAIPRITEVVQAVDTVDPASFGYGSAEGGAGVAFMSVTVTTAVFFGAAFARYTRLLR